MNVCEVLDEIGAEIVDPKCRSTISQFDDDGRRKPQSALLIELGQEADLFADINGSQFVRIKQQTHAEVWPLRSAEFREWLAGKYYYLTQRGANRNALTEALDTLGAQAIYQQRCRQQVGRRVMWFGDTVVIDLCDPEWRAVCVSADGWEIVPQPVPMVRSGNAASLPIPECGGQLTDLAHYVNLSPEDLPLLIAWTIAALWPDGPYPVLILQGEQGTGKSTTTRRLRSLVDPSIVALREPPKDIEALRVCAVANHIVAYDNLSGARPWLSDALCRLSTGGGFSARKLYSDTDEVAIDLQRPVILNGIDDIANRADLASRSTILHLPRLSGIEQAETSLNAAWGEARPKLFGSICDALSAAIKNRGIIKPSASVRMADFLSLVVAAEPATGLERGEIENAYHKKAVGSVETALEASAIGRAVQDFMASRYSWTGRATDLLAALRSIAVADEKLAPGWPRTAHHLSNQLRRIAPALLQVGIDFDDGSRSATRRTLRLHRLPETASSASKNGEKSIRNDTDDAENRNMHKGREVASARMLPSNAATL